MIKSFTYDTCDISNDNQYPTLRDFSAVLFEPGSALPLVIILLILFLSVIRKSLKNVVVKMPIKE